MIQSIETYKKYAVLPSLIHHISVNEFVIKDCYRDCFDRYFLLYWSSTHFLDELRSGQITKDNLPYIVIYGCHSSRGRILHSSPESQVAISFRKPKAEFNIPGYALVQLINR